MLDKIAALPALSRNRTAAGRIARMEERIDLLTKLLANLTGGLGISVHLSPRNVIEISAAGGDGDGDNGVVSFGFAVSVDKEDDHVHVATGAAQAWGLGVKVYPAADLGSAKAGWIYAVLNLDGSSGPAWINSLRYDSMDGQNANTQVFVPIARIDGNANDGWTVTQLHWGNIVIPAVTNAVDVQESTQEGGNQ